MAGSDGSSPNLSTPGPAPARGADGAAAPAEGPRYREVGLLGTGGMGVVHAVHDARLGRQVARKRPRDGVRGADLAVEDEALLTSILEHPGIVPVYDAGEDADGRPWYTMRLIRGRTLREVIAEQGSLSSRLALVRPVLSAVEAVAYAHARGVVHCDLKAPNILLGEHGEVQVIDWGLAGTARAGGGGGTVATMAPEQARREPATAASDVWGLGMVLLEVLTGAVPHDGGSSEEVRRRVAGGVVPPIPTEGVPADLRAIVARCLQLDPAARYRDAGALADDLSRFLDGRMVAAHLYTPGELLGRWVERYRLPILVGVVALGVVVVLAGIATARIVAERDAARAAEGAAQLARQRSDQSYAHALVLASRAAAARGARAEAEVLATHALRLVESPEARGVLARFGASMRPTFVVDPLPPCEGRRVFGAGDTSLCATAGRIERFEGLASRWSTELDYADVAFAGDDVLLTFRGNTAGVLDGGTGALRWRDAPLASAFSSLSGPRRGFVISGSTLHVVDPAVGMTTHHPCGSTAVVHVVELDGDALLIACDVGGLIRFDPVSEANAPSLSPVAAHRGAYRRLAVGPDGAVALGTDRGEVGILDAVGVRFQVDLGGTVTDLAFTSDGRRLVVVQWQLGPIVLDAATGASLGRLPHGVGAMRGPDGPSGVRFAGRGGARWDLGAIEPTVYPGDAGISALIDDAPVGVALGRGDGRVRLLRASDGAILGDTGPADAVVKAIAWMPDQGFATLRTRGGLRLYGPDLALQRTVSGAVGRRVGRLGRDVVVLDYVRPGVVADLATGSEAPLTDEGSAWYDLGASPDAAAAGAVAEDGGLWLIRAGAPPTATRIGRVSEAAAVDVTSDGRVVTATRGAVTLWAADGTSRALPHPDVTVLDVVVSPDDRFIATAGLDAVVRVLDLDDGRLIASLEGHEQRVSALAWHDPRVLWSGSWDGAVRRWGLADLTADAHDLARGAEEAWALQVEDALAAGAP
jgi:eukaryotic-like serine/threonine-protein kinase